MGPGGDWLVIGGDRAMQTFAVTGRFGAFGPLLPFDMLGQSSPKLTFTFLRVKTNAKFGKADKKTEVDRSGCSNRDAAHFAIFTYATPWTPKPGCPKSKTIRKLNRPNRLRA